MTTVVVTVAYVLVLVSAGAVTALKRKWISLGVGLVFFPVWLVAAVRLAKPDSWWARRFYSDAKRARARRRLVDPVHRAAAAAALTLSLLLSGGAIAFVKPYRLPTSAMEPTFHCAEPLPGCEAGTSDRVVALRYVFGKRAGRGDIVAYRSTPAQEARCGTRGTFLHRVVALPGERVSGRGASILIDGQPLDEPYVARERNSGNAFAAVELPPGHYFVVGDNRAASCDSRIWGPLPERNLVARVVAVYWPPSRIGLA